MGFEKQLDHRTEQVLNNDENLKKTKNKNTALTWRLWWWRDVRSLPDDSRGTGSPLLLSDPQTACPPSWPGCRVGSCGPLPIQWSSYITNTRNPITKMDFWRHPLKIWLYTSRYIERQSPVSDGFKFICFRILMRFLQRRMKYSFDDRAFLCIRSHFDILNWIYDSGEWIITGV